MTVDMIIIIVLLMGAVIGFKRGFTRELVSLCGIFAIIILSFLLKNPISIFLYEHLPFFGFTGIFKGVTVLNIALYEIIAFLITMVILTVIFKILVLATSIFEKILTATIILGIPSKIIGAILGVIESYIWVFILLYVLSLPVFNLNFSDSNLKITILEKTPVLSSFTLPMVNTVREFSDLKEKYESDSNASEFNRDTLDLFLKYGIITVDSVDELIEKNKLKIDNAEEILVKYREV